MKTTFAIPADVPGEIGTETRKLASAAIARRLKCCARGLKNYYLDRPDSLELFEQETDRIESAQTNVSVATIRDARERDAAGEREYLEAATGWKTGAPWAIRSTQLTRWKPPPQNRTPRERPQFNFSPGRASVMTDAERAELLAFIRAIGCSPIALPKDINVTLESSTVAKTPEAPCASCGKMNDVGIAVCWCCGGAP